MRTRQRRLPQTISFPNFSQTVSQLDLRARLQRLVLCFRDLGDTLSLAMHVPANKWWEDGAIICSHFQLLL